ncbi:hypothetical protein V7O62_07325 [Methanolobus sp. ZRKC2]|uniref:hypothetical protein n=1 Tax=Methanolobus sp. ZRKC2 TaxID=3125783 RepID=UPI00324A6CC8
MQVSGYRTIFMYILIISISFVAIACIQADSPLSNSNVNSVTVLMDSGHVYVPVENQAVAPIEVRSDVLVEKPAAATLSGTIDENDFVVLEGIIILDGQNETVKLSGNATHGIVGWSVSEGEAYAAKVDLKDENSIFFLQGTFLEDGRGSFFGKAAVGGKKCTIRLEGNSTGIYENVNQVEVDEIDP